MGEQLYVIVYRDGTLGRPRTWRRLLFFIGIARDLPFPLAAAVVLTYPDPAPALELIDAASHADVLAL